MKKMQLVAAFLCLVLFLCSCSPGSSMDKDNYAAGPGDQLSGAETPETDNSGILSDRKLIRRISMSAETEDLDTLLSSLNQRIAALQGYVESRDVYNGSSYSGRGYRSATLVIRIPADRLDSFVEQVGQTSNIVSTKETSDDVTLQYVDTQSRLKVLRTEEERLLAFLAEAASVSEMLEVEKRLTQVQAEIESLTSQLKTYDNLVSYGTVTLSISEVEVYTPTAEPGLWQTIGDTFQRSLKGLGNICQGLLVFFLGYSPYLLLVAVFAGGIVLLVYLSNRPKKKKKEEN